MFNSWWRRRLARTLRVKEKAQVSKSSTRCLSTQTVFTTWVQDPLATIMANFICWALLSTIQINQQVQVCVLYLCSRSTLFFNLFSILIKMCNQHQHQHQHQYLIDLSALLLRVKSNTLSALFKLTVGDRRRKTDLVVKFLGGKFISENHLTLCNNNNNIVQVCWQRTSAPSSSYWSWQAASFSFGRGRAAWWTPWTAKQMSMSLSHIHNRQH